MKWLPVLKFCSIIIIKLVVLTIRHDMFVYHCSSGTAEHRDNDVIGFR